VKIYIDLYWLGHL